MEGPYGMTVNYDLEIKIYASWRKGPWRRRNWFEGKEENSLKKKIKILKERNSMRLNEKPILEITANFLTSLI